MDPVLRDMDYVHSWLDRRCPDYIIEKKFQNLDAQSRKIAAIYQLRVCVVMMGYESFEALPFDFMLPDAIAFLNEIGADRMASVTHEYLELIKTNPYLGPVPKWPNRKAPQGTRSKIEKAKINRLDDEWGAALQDYGSQRLWAEIVARIERIETDT